jgi:hypothetical protein
LTMLNTPSQGRLLIMPIYEKHYSMTSQDKRCLLGFYPTLML